MIGKLIGAFVGDKLARHTREVGGATGAALGVVAAGALRRMSLPSMLAIAAGGYAAKRMADKKAREPNPRPKAATQGRAAV